MIIRERQLSGVYFVQATHGGPIKIGCASHVRARVTSFMAGNPAHLAILGVIPGDRYVEHQLHHRFKAHRVRGEWFAPAPDLLAFIGDSLRSHLTKHPGFFNTDNVYGR